MKLLMNQKSKSKSKVVQDTTLKLLMKFHQSCKTMNKIIVQLMKKLQKPAFFTPFLHTTPSIVLNIREIAQHK